MWSPPDRHVGLLGEWTPRELGAYKSFDKADGGALRTGVLRDVAVKTFYFGGVGEMPDEFR